MFRQPVLVYAADGPGLGVVRERAAAREMPVAIYTEDMFATGHDEANRAVVRAVAPATSGWPGSRCTGRATRWTRSARAWPCTPDPGRARYRQRPPVTS